MNVLLVVSSSLHLLLHVLITFVSPATPPRGCTDELVSMSVCLGYISAPPNNFEDVAGIDCCEAFSKILDSENTNCLCYLITDQLFFGFPLNVSRVASLPSRCSTNSTLAIDSLCSGRPANESLPPLNGITGAVRANPFGSVPRIFTSPPSPSLPPPSPPRRPSPTFNSVPQLDRTPQIADRTPATSTRSKAQPESAVRESSNSNSILHFPVYMIIWLITAHILLIAD